MSAAAAGAAAAADAVNTLAVVLKERMVLMPDKLDTKKEIDEFYKNAMKEIAEEKKKNKKVVVKPEVKAKKPAKKNLDENGEEKPKRPLTKYQIFLKEWQPKIKEAHPELSNTERFAKIAEEWQKQKATYIAKADPTDPTDPADPIDSDEEALPVVVEPEPVVKKEVKKVKEAKNITIALDEVTAPSSDEVAPIVESVAPVAKKNLGGRAGIPNKVRKSIVKKEVAADAAVE
jgi:hypothetical protein